ncbi:hypothetical protein KW800_01925 [Candidatus Parcubacteria bacterium]|nr:hypothetical protein [Candidatus Parcubacteria bacterium]
MQNIDKFHNVIVTGNGLGPLWTIGWLFTIGYLRLTFWRGVLAIIIWPYYIGKKFHKAS